MLVGNGISIPRLDVYTRVFMVLAIEQYFCISLVQIHNDNECNNIFHSII